MYRSCHGVPLNVDPTLGDSQVKSSTAKDACLSLFQALGRILYKKGRLGTIFLNPFDAPLLGLDSEENVNDQTKMYPEVISSESPRLQWYASGL